MFGNSFRSLEPIKPQQSLPRNIKKNTETMAYEGIYMDLHMLGRWNSVFTIDGKGSFSRFLGDGSHANCTKTRLTPVAKLLPVGPIGDVRWVLIHQLWVCRAQ